MQCRVSRATTGQEGITAVLRKRKQKYTEGPMGERYCSENCYELGGQTVARHQIQGWSGDCSVCRGPLSIGTGASGSMVCYKPDLFLYFHQTQSCAEAVRAELARGSACVICGESLR